jgi:NADP-dependent 3-hydroxy acid dehydrogenase YdfG
MKTILITGAGTGIGRATALQITARLDCHLIITGRRKEKLQELSELIHRTTGSKVYIFEFDIRDRVACETFWTSLPEELKNVDILINNAGLAKGLSEIHEGDFDHWDQMIDTNIKGLLYLTRLVSPQMVSRRTGHIVNVGSIAGKETYPKGNVYNATKFAVEGLTRAIRMDLYKYNIKVSSVSPGAVEETEFAIVRFDGDAEKAKIYDGYTPLKADDIASMIYFIISQPAHINIQDIFVTATQQGSATLTDRSGRI